METTTETIQEEMRDMIAEKKRFYLSVFFNIRCGMIYLDTAMLGTKSLIKAWIKNEMPSFLENPQKEKIQLLAMWLIEPCTEFVTKNCEQFLVFDE